MSESCSSENWLNIVRIPTTIRIVYLMNYVTTSVPVLSYRKKNICQHLSFTVRFLKLKCSKPLFVDYMPLHVTFYRTICQIYQIGRPCFTAYYDTTLFFISLFLLQRSPRRIHYPSRVVQGHSSGYPWGAERSGRIFFRRRLQSQPGILPQGK